MLVLGNLLTMIPALASDIPEPGRDTSIIGEWEIKSVLDYATISVGEDQARSLIGKDLIISKEKIEFGNRVCSESNFLAESVETNIELRENARTSNDRLRLPNPVTVVELSCAYAYIRDKNRIVLAWNGVFFDAVRKRRPGSTTLPRQPSTGTR
ncbi:hypothetical protein [Massilia oculi]|uniref:hypothetical protein n=1 Tax=Massilia oculi TaxID=945844 RepID=UPI0028B1D0B8|nr:hypothetical protein [Massilia oculi]